MRGGAEIPALNHNMVWFDAGLVLNNPDAPISRHEPYTITWAGAGPQLVWLAVYGPGVDGSFVFNGKMRPNTGELVLTPEDLAVFEDGATVTVFLQQSKAGYLFQGDFHRASFAYISGASTMTMTVQ